MVSWVAVFLLALAGVSAAHQPAFIEDVNERVERSAGSRIVSGWEADEGQFPHQLSLRMVNEAGTVSSCGASIIHPEWGLTAAHCTALRVTIVIRAGATNLTTPEYIFETTEYYNHPQYIDQIASIVQPHDISLLKFNRALIWSSHVQPIRLQSSADMNKDYSGVELTASGWGRTWTSGSAPEIMNWVYQRGISNLECWDAYFQSSIIVDSTICTRYYNVTSQSTCQGDSGGVLSIVDVDGVVTQVGVTSFVSASGCHVDIPAGFIRPGHYHEWYIEVTGINFDWEPLTTTTEGPITGSPAPETTSEGPITGYPTIETTTTPEGPVTGNPTTETEIATTTVADSSPTTEKDDSEDSEDDSEDSDDDSEDSEDDSKDSESGSEDSEDDSEDSESDSEDSESDSEDSESDSENSEDDSEDSENDSKDSESDSKDSESDSVDSDNDSKDSGDSENSEDDNEDSDDDDYFKRLLQRFW